MPTSSKIHQKNDAFMHHFTVNMDLFFHYRARVDARLPRPRRAFFISPAALRRISPQF